MVNADILKRKHKKFISTSQQGVYKIEGSAGCFNYGKGSGFLDWLKERAVLISEKEYQYLLQANNCLTEVLFRYKVNSHPYSMNNREKFSYDETVDIFWQPNNKSPITLINKLENFGFIRFIS
jgi:hypothetical protein